MTMTTDTYCDHLHRLNLEDAIRAIHQAYCQLRAIEAGAENTDNKQAIEDLSGCLRQAGHLGFTPQEDDPHAKFRHAVKTCERFFREAMPQMNLRDSALDANAIDAWNKAEIAVTQAMKCIRAEGRTEDLTAPPVRFTATEIRDDARHRYMPPVNLTKIIDR